MSLRCLPRWKIAASAAFYPTLICPKDVLVELDQQVPCSLLHVFNDLHPVCLLHDSCSILAKAGTHAGSHSSNGWLSLVKACGVSDISSKEDEGCCVDDWNHLQGWDNISASKRDDQRSAWTMHRQVLHLQGACHHDVTSAEQACPMLMQHKHISWTECWPFRRSFHMHSWFLLYPWLGH